MNSTNSEIPQQKDVMDSSKKEKEHSQNPIKNHSATTNDLPDFGWSAYSERVNGRFAMIGFIAILVVEAFSKSTFLHWSGLMP